MPKGPVTLFRNTHAAVTLIDVIVFRNADDAARNRPLWAHELRHVQQYGEWGTRDFSLRYTRNAGAVEDEAYAIERQVRSDLQVSRAPPLPAPAPFYPTPPRTVQFCRTPAGTCQFPPTIGQPGMLCHCGNFNGTAF